jgi:long-subunit fatty acid transport protein
MRGGGEPSFPGARPSSISGHATGVHARRLKTEWGIWNMIDLATGGGRGVQTCSVGLSGCVVASVCFTACALLTPTPARASCLLTPAVGAADSATVGTRVADPPTPAAALFSNPAGLTDFDTLTHGGGLGVGYGRGRIDASMPAGFNDATTMWPLIPDFGLSAPYRNRWRFAAGTYGCTGSKFDFGPDPATGVPNFFSETIVMAVPVGAAYRFTDHVSVGAEVQPMFGQLRTHFQLCPFFPCPSQAPNFRYKINGPGVQGMVGATVRPNEQWVFGLGVRTPGMIWLTGSMPVPNAGRQGVHSDLEMPTQVFTGATWRGLPRLALSAGVRFTDSSTFGDSKIEYDLTPQANIGFIPDAHDEWKFGLAAEYAVAERTVLRLGSSWASHIVGSKGVSPLVFDGDDTKISIGVGQRLGHWGLDLTAGWALPAERHISPASALVIPGAYSMEGAVVLLGLTYY